MPLEDRLIDRAILKAADGAIRRELPDAKPVLLMANDPALYQAQEKMLEDEASVTALLAPLRATLAGANATHLLLFTRYRHAAYFVMGNAHVGTGMIDGAGFYTDSRLMTRRSQKVDTLVRLASREASEAVRELIAAP